MILRLIILIFLIFTYHEIQEINLNLKTLKERCPHGGKYDNHIFEEWKHRSIAE
jgi:hypothetical protein